MYNPSIHHRRSIRLRGYDYSKDGLYFITICIQNRLQLLGRIENKQLILSDAGQMVEKWYYELENKYPDKRCHEMIIMPNHIHFIIENLPSNVHRDAHEGTSLRGRPEPDERGRPELDERGRPEPDERGRPEPDERGRPKPDECGCPKPDHIVENENNYGMENKKYLATISDAMDWFKTMTTNEYIRGVKQFEWQRFNGKLWQRTYWDRIIRNEHSYIRISEYIKNNPENWDTDSLK